MSPIQCPQHNFLYGSKGYFCKKCGYIAGSESQNFMINNTVKNNKKTRSKKEFFKGVMTGLGITLSVGFVAISVLLIFRI
jgi:hypothetical protein